MKIRTPIKLVPIILSGLLSMSSGYVKKNKDNNFLKYLNLDKKVIVSQDGKTKKIDFVNDENDNNISYYVLAMENSYIYDSTSTKSKKAGMLAKGESLKYLGKYDDEWLIVSFDGRECFIKSDYLDFIESYEVNSNIPNINSIDEISEYLYETDIVIATSTVNVREYNNTKSNILNKLNKGESLPLIKEIDEWYEVNYGGKSAYVYKKYAKIIKGYYAKKDIQDMVYITSKTSLLDINNNEVIKPIPKQEVAEVYASFNNYYLVKCGGLFGFVLKDYTCSLGDNYVIIDISSQILRVYINDKLILETKIVTGKDSSPTYCGIFSVYKKEENVRWDEFNVTVQYWMPFNRGEGMHDASWRKEFGGEIYHKNGSHGCVNVPVDIMPIIYDNIEVGSIVLVKK